MLCAWERSHRRYGIFAMVDDFDPQCIHDHHAALVKVAWARNWFERWCQHTWFGLFDLYLASSLASASDMGSRLSKLVREMRIATNTERFNVTDRPAATELDYVFTGSYWDADRDIIAALDTLAQTLRGAIYGNNWHKQPQLARLDKGFVRYLPAVYRQAAIVIDDANHVTKTWGAANSRVFDALAAGCLVITNSESVSQDVFSGELPVYKSNAELVQLLTKFVNDTDGRATLQQRLRQQVLAKHGYMQRAFELRGHLARWTAKQGDHRQT